MNPRYSFLLLLLAFALLWAGASAQDSPDYVYEAQAYGEITLTTPTATVYDVFEADVSAYSTVEAQVSYAALSNTDLDTTVTVTLESSMDGTNYDTLASFTVVNETTGASATRERKSVLRTTSAHLGRYIRAAYTTVATSETATMSPTMRILLIK